MNAEGSIVVRPAVSEDFDSWLPLWHGYNAFYGRVGATALTDDVTDDRWAAFLSPEVPMWALLAWQGKSVVGLAHYLFHLSTTSLAPSCYMQDLFTMPDSRKAGVGGYLIDAVAAQARRVGCPSLYWQTHRTNRTAMRLYDRVAAKSEFLVYRMPLHPEGRE